MKVKLWQTVRGAMTRHKWTKYSLHISDWPWWGKKVRETKMFKI